MKESAAEKSAAEKSVAAGGPARRFKPLKGALASRFGWFADEDRLSVVATDLTMKPFDTDVGLAHALGHLEDRDLIVVFPRARQND